MLILDDSIRRIVTIIADEDAGQARIPRSGVGYEYESARLTPAGVGSLISAAPSADLVRLTGDETVYRYTADAHSVWVMPKLTLDEAIDEIGQRSHMLREIARAAWEWELGEIERRRNMMSGDLDAEWPGVDDAALVGLSRKEAAALGRAMAQLEEIEAPHARGEEGTR